MAESPQTRGPWQPFTFGGVARFASAPISRLIWAAFLMAMLSGSVIGWFIGKCWAPVVTESITVLPEGSSIRYGQLIWPEKTSTILAHNLFLSFSVNTSAHQGEHTPADLRVTLEPTKVIIHGLFGAMPIPYPSQNEIRLDRAEFEPLWGAWKPAIIATIIALSAAGLMVTWALLAVPYAIVPRLFGFYLDRKLTLAGAWKMGYASLFPGAVLLTFGIALYALGEIGVLLLGILFAAHFLVGWIFLLFSPFSLEASEAEPEKRKANPFRTEPAPKKRQEKNPFKVLSD